MNKSKMCERLKKNKINVARIIYFMLDVRTAFVIKLKKYCPSSMHFPV